MTPTADEYRAEAKRFVGDYDFGNTAELLIAAADLAEKVEKVKAFVQRLGHGQPCLCIACRMERALTGEDDQ